MGPTFVALPLDAFFGGILAMQVMNYWSSDKSREDSWWIKGLIIQQSLCTAVDSILGWGWSWDCFVRYYSEFWAFSETRWLRGIYIIFGSEFYMGGGTFGGV